MTSQTYFWWALVAHASARRGELQLKVPRAKLAAPCGAPCGALDGAQPECLDWIELDGAQSQHDQVRLPPERLPIVCIPGNTHVQQPSEHKNMCTVAAADVCRATWNGLIWMNGIGAGGCGISSRSASCPLVSFRWWHRVAAPSAGLADVAASVWPTRVIA